MTSEMLDAIRLMTEPLPTFRSGRVVVDREAENILLQNSPWVPREVPIIYIRHNRQPRVIQETPDPYFEESCNGARMANRQRLGHNGIIFGVLGREISMPKHELRAFKRWVALRRIAGLRAARGIPYDEDSITSACDFEPL